MTNPVLNDPIGLLTVAAPAVLESSRREEDWKPLEARNGEVAAFWQKARIEGARILEAILGFEGL